MAMGAPVVPPFLVVRNISKAFGGAKALRNASLDIVAGRFTGWSAPMGRASRR